MIKTSNSQQGSGSTAQPGARFLDPGVLAGLKNLELVARTLVNGVLMGLHRSPNFGFSQEFVEYRAYNEGDDPRMIDWNLFARSDRTFIKRFRGETNSHLQILLDTSASMGFRSEQASVSKLDYAKFLAASLAYLASRQKDAVGLMLFDEKVVAYRAPSSRAGQLQALLHSIDQAQASQSTEINVAVARSLAAGKQRGLVAVISDFYCDHQALLKSVRPLAIQGQDLVLFQVLDPQEISPDIRESTLLEDLESGSLVEVSPDYMNSQYRDRLANHIQALKDAAGALRADHILLDSSQPLDESIRRYLRFREKRL